MGPFSAVAENSGTTDWAEPHCLGLFPCFLLGGRSLSADPRLSPRVIRSQLCTDVIIHVPVTYIMAVAWQAVWLTWLALKGGGGSITNRYVCQLFFFIWKSSGLIKLNLKMNGFTFLSKRIYSIACCSLYSHVYQRKIKQTPHRQAAGPTQESNPGPSCSDFIVLSIMWHLLNQFIHSRDLENCLSYTPTTIILANTGDITEIIVLKIHHSKTSLLRVLQMS